MKPNTNTPPALEAQSTSVHMLVDEFASDIRRRARAVECLLEPRRPAWSFDLDALPIDNAERLVAIKREVEKTFNAIFSNRPRSRGSVIPSNTPPTQSGMKNSPVSRSVA